MTNQKQFEQFCAGANIPCTAISADLYFQNGKCDGAFETFEYSFDAQMICKYLLDQLSKSKNFTLFLDTKIQKIFQEDDQYLIHSTAGNHSTGFLINATYASLNQILIQTGLSPFQMKYEICELVLCKVSPALEKVGITLMDGPFFSLMPFGKTGFHSLTSVSNTPHLHSREVLPTFKCQSTQVDCSPHQLANCNDCFNKPKTAFGSMYQLAKNYLKEEFEISYQKSLFSMKTVLLSSEIDDSRPTVIKINHENPRFLSVFSGKINTIYDLNEFI